MAAGNNCFASRDGNVWINTSGNQWIKCISLIIKRHFGKNIKKKTEEFMAEYFRKPYLGDHWSGKVVPKKN